MPKRYPSEFRERAVRLVYGWRGVRNRTDGGLKGSPESWACISRRCETGLKAEVDADTHGFDPGGRLESLEVSRGEPPAAFLPDGAIGALTWALVPTIIEHMFDTDGVSGEAGLEPTTHDFEADLELAGDPAVELSDVVYERHMERVGVVDAAMGQLNLAQLGLIDRIIEADANGLWVSDGSPSLAEWLAARYRMTLFTGRTLARIAETLPELPMIRQLFAEGRLSWDQLRAVVNIATADTDAELARKAPELTPSQIRAVARRVDEQVVAEARESRYVTYEFLEDEPIFEMKLRLPDEEGATFITALTRRAGQVDLDPYDGGVPEHGVRLADALVRMASESLAADPDHDRATLLVRTDIPTLLGVEGAAPSTLGDGTMVPRGTTINNETLRRLACDARIQLALEDPADGVVGIGRTSRTIPAWLARIVRARDGGCRFPGCHRTLWLQVHHLIHWADGGPTNLDNLITLCGFHHRLIHNQGWRIQGDPNGEVTWITKWGTAFERHPHFAGIETIREVLADPMPVEPPLRRTA